MTDTTSQKITELQSSILKWRIEYQEKHGTGLPHVVRLTRPQWELLGGHKCIFGMEVKLR